MSLNEKLTIKEKSVKLLFENIKTSLNKASTFSKQNPNDWKYLTVLSLTENKLKELENQINEIIGEL
ncbi:MAG: hypothetical protein NTW54_07665 [Bacteroidetes bacterium]|nr:hypothetical protein [Bacteroidota bacterium]